MESTTATGDRHPHGQVHTEVVDEHILVMTVDRVEKKNAFTPKISNELLDAMTRLDHDEPTAIAAIPAMSAEVQATEDFAEGIASFLERRPARFTGR